MPAPDNDDCLFCKIRDGKIPADVVYRDDDVISFKDIKPHAPMHLLVIPTRHIAKLSDATAADAEILGRLLVTASRLARDLGYAEDGFRVVMNSGAAAGQTVFHVHLHVLGGRALTWPPG